MESTANPMRLIFLGTGTSTGVPEIGCGCYVCKSTNRYDKRLRSSALIITPKGKRILIDCSPDFRQQAMSIGLDYLDAIIITHEHYDHIGGLDDLRTIAWKRDLPIYAEANVLEAIKKRLHYYFRPDPYPGTPRLKLCPISLAPFEIEDITIKPIRVMHGNLPIIGFRIKNMSYITDMKTIDEAELQKIADCPLIIINGLREQKPHPTHQSIQDAINLFEKLNADSTGFITHISHHAPPHNAIEELLPDNIHPAYDFMELSIDEQNHITTNYYMNKPEPFIFEYWNRINYGSALNKQRELFNNAISLKKEGKPVENIFIFCEHDPVITFGMHAKEENLLVNNELLKQKGIELFQTERGGDITFHGPGQIIGYPIIDLELFHLGLKDYIALLEEGIIEVLKKYDVTAERKDGATGVWIDVGNKLKERKICAIGVKSSRYITMHGFALNITTDLSGFQLMNPCGFVGGQTTSLEKECGYTPDINVVRSQLSDIYTALFTAKMK